MSGPALEKKASHGAIHEAAYEEARELTTLLRKMADAKGDPTRLLEFAYLLVEHWETRTLAHATAEEQGLYPDMVEKYPELCEKIKELKSEHNLLRQLVSEIQELLPESGVNEEVLSRFDRLLEVNAAHNAKEENQFLQH
ncbi:MAG TPA: hemerythrin domain-containing protein [Bacillales bacterium]|nr:hemerythrin domain-containing protein [Bacillales bacterium]